MIKITRIQQVRMNKVTNQNIRPLIKEYYKTKSHNSFAYILLTLGLTKCIVKRNGNFVRELISDPLNERAIVLL